MLISHVRSLSSYLLVPSNHLTDWTTMHHPAPTSSELGFLPDMYSFSGPTSLPEFNLGSPSTSGDLQRATLSSRYVADYLGGVNPLHTFVINALEMAFQS